MTAEQRLDQLELLMVQALATLDQHTAQNERQTSQLKMIINVLAQHGDAIAQQGNAIAQHGNAIAQQSSAIAQQSDNIVFLLNKVSTIEGEIVELKSGQSGMNKKLDLILEHLTGGSK